MIPARWVIGWVGLMLAALPATRASAAAAWSSAADPSEARPKFRSDLKLSISLREANFELILPNRPSSFIAFSDRGMQGDTIGVLDMRTGQYAGTLRGRLLMQRPLLSPDGLYLAGKVEPTDTTPAGYEVWNVKTGAMIQRTPAPDKQLPPEVLGFSSPFQIVLHYRSEGTLQVCDFRTRKVLTETPLPGSLDLRGYALSPNGRFLLVLQDLRLKAFDLSTGTALGEAALPPPLENGRPVLGISHCRGLVYAPNGLEAAALFASADFKRIRILCWDLATGQVRHDHITPFEPEPLPRDPEKLTFEYLPDHSGWRFGGRLFDRQSGKAIYTMNLEGMPMPAEGWAYTLLDSEHFLATARPAPDRAETLVAPLPRFQINAAIEQARAVPKTVHVPLPALNSPNRSEIKELNQVEAPGKWLLKITPGAVAKLPAQPIALRFSPSTEADKTAYGPTGVFLSGGASAQAAVVYELSEADPTAPATPRGLGATVERIDLASGAVSGTFALPAGSRGVDLSADGSCLLTRIGDRLDAWALPAATPPNARSAPAAAPQPPRHLAGFRPLESSPATLDPKQPAPFSFAALLDAGHVLAAGRSDNRLTLWSIPDCKALYSVPLSWKSLPCLSPDRKLLALWNGAGVSVLDPLSGEAISSLPAPQGNQAALAFSPEGTRLAALFEHFGIRYLVLWDLRTGQIVRWFPVAEQGTLRFCGSNHLLVGEHLIDLDRRVTIWRYTADALLPQPAGQADDRLWYVGRSESDRRPALCALSVPHPEARLAVAAFKASDLLAVKPGMKVSLELNVQGSADYQKEVREALSKRLTDNGLSVSADEQALRLVVSTTASGSRPIQFSGRSGAETVALTTYSVRVGYVLEGKRVWEVVQENVGFAPGSVWLSENETLQDYVNRMQAKPASWVLLNLHPPRYVAYQPEASAIGHWVLGERGPLPPGGGAGGRGAPGNGDWFR